MARLANWSEWMDLNQRLPAPEAGALPNCATPRQMSALQERRLEAERESERRANIAQSKPAMSEGWDAPVESPRSHSAFTQRLDELFEAQLHP